MQKFLHIVDNKSSKIEIFHLFLVFGLGILLHFYKKCPSTRTIIRNKYLFNSTNLHKVTSPNVMKCTTKSYSYKSKERNIEPLQILHLKKSLFLNPWVISKQQQFIAKRKRHGKKLYKVTMLQNFNKTYLVSTPLMKVENTRHFPSVDVVARRICSQYLRNTFRHHKWMLPCR